MSHKELQDLKNRVEALESMQERALAALEVIRKYTKKTAWAVELLERWDCDGVQANHVYMQRVNSDLMALSDEMARRCHRGPLLDERALCESRDRELLQCIDMLAVALAEHGHHWTYEQRQAHERCAGYLSSTSCEEVITRSCTLSTESGMGEVLQGISPSQFDRDTGMYLGSPATPEQLAVLGSIAGTLHAPCRPQNSTE